MEIHPSWFAKFTPEAGGPIHQQYCTHTSTFVEPEPRGKHTWTWLAGYITTTQEPVWSLHDSGYYYRRADFIALYKIDPESIFP